ncbi:MAG: DM13 domain-containing protein [Cyanobacteria bacterium P01_F01_bin.53]
MKGQLLNKIGLSGLMIAIATLSYQPITQAESTLSTALSTQILAQAATPTASFVGDAHPTTGSAQIVEVEGQRYLEFDGAFRTDAGADLVVLLHNEAVPESYNADNYINLGQVQRVAGVQRYAIPADADLASVQSAVIWCREFNVTFGYATF